MAYLIRRATVWDWKAIQKLIGYNQYLQQDRLPSYRDFVVLQVGGEVLGCCALKIYGKKLAEIRSLAFFDAELKERYAKLLVKKCAARAKQKQIYQLLATVGKQEKLIFKSLGFRPFNNEKYAMLMVLRNQRFFEECPVPGIVIQRAEEQHRSGIHALVGKYPGELIQHSSKLFPEISDFFVAVKASEPDVVLGCTALVIFQLKQGEDPEMAEIRSVVVDQSCKGLGVGPQLVTRCINQAIELQVWELLAITKLKEWFEAFGFGIHRGAEEAYFMVLGNGNGN